MEALKAIQDGEVEALQAIFGDDFEKVEVKTAWKNVAAPLEFCIKADAEEEDLKGSVGVTLRFKLTRNYPKAPPTISIEAVRGVSPSQVDTLRTTLTHKASELVGAEMIFELVSLASNFVTEHHSIVRDVQHTSLIEERLVRSTEAREKQQRDDEAETLRQEALQRSEDLELTRQVSEHLEKKAELVRREKQKAAAMAPSIGTSGALGSSEKSLPIPTSFTFQVGAKSLYVTRSLAVPGVHVGQVFTGQVGGLEAARLQIIDIKGRYYESQQGKRKLSKVQEDIERASKLRQANVHQILALGFTDLRLVVVSEAAPAATLKDVLDQCGNFRADKAVAYTLQLLKALAAVHEAHLVHRAVKPCNVFLYPASSEVPEPSVKLANTSWLQRLSDLNNSNPFATFPRENSIPDAWLCPGVVEEPLVYDRSRDLHDLGVAFAQMLFGLEVYYTFASPSALIQSLPEGFSPPALLGLTELLTKKTLPDANELLHRLQKAVVPNASILDHARRQSMMSLGSARLAPMPTPAPMEDGQRGFFWQPQAAPQVSRYRADFEEVEFLGKGGFGRVVKARNRLDGRFYAIKKITMPTDANAEQKILREVTIWSRMNHVYVVRYHACWFEVEDSSPPDPAPSTPLAPKTIKAAPAPRQTSSDDDSSSSSSEEQSDQDTDEDDNTVFNMEIEQPDFDDFLSAGNRNLDVSLPSIRFGTASMTDSAAASRSMTPAPSDDNSQVSDDLRARRTFYMQMEYVDSQTLKEQIERGFDDDAETWRIARQILSAMTHYVSLHIIHRDLKPSNIFLDAKGDVRIGDFGLAVNQQGQDIDPAVAADDVNSDLTSGVGTGLYIAPELLSRSGSGSAKYTDKIDIYSFGILMVEVWMHMTTGHERVQVIRDLRRPEIVFPRNWPFPMDSPKTRLIKWCLDHNPEKRPSAQELLKSDIFPAQPEEDNVAEVVRLLTQPDHPLTHQFFPLIFERPAHDLARRDLAFDFHDADLSRDALDDPYNSIISNHLAHKFRQRGAIPFDSPLLLPKSDDPRKLVELIDSDGNVACLHYDTATPFARMIARDTSITRLKRFSLQSVYRRNPTGGQPIAIPAASFDIVSSSITLAAEAETIELVDDCLSGLPLSEGFEHVVNHGALWNAVFRNVPDNKRSVVHQMLDNYSRNPAASWRDLTSEVVRWTGLSKTVFEDIRMLFDVCDDVEALERHFKESALPSSPLLTDALQDLRKISVMATRLGCRRPIRVWPLLAPAQQSFFTGVFFISRSFGRRKDTLVVGGRYDGLVRKLSSPANRSAQTTSLISASFAISKLSRSVARHVRDAGDSAAMEEWRPRRCEVYVISYSEGLLEGRLDAVKELWNAGLSADLMYDEDWKTTTTSPETMLQTCRAEGVLFLVIVKSKHSQVVRVKSVLQRTETEVDILELASWLEEALAEHRKTHGTLQSSGPGLRAQAKTTEAASSAREVQVLLPGDATRKLKHRSRQMTLDRAPALVGENMKAVLNVPIFAVELEDPAFTRLATDNSWLTSAEAYRSKVVDAVPTSRKTYAWEIRDAILAHKTKVPSDKWIWLFSLKVGSCQLLPLTAM